MFKNVVRHLRGLQYVVTGYMTMLYNVQTVPTFYFNMLYNMLYDMFERFVPGLTMRHTFIRFLEKFHRPFYQKACFLILTVPLSPSSIAFSKRVDYCSETDGNTSLKDRNTLSTTGNNNSVVFC